MSATDPAKEKGQTSGTMTMLTDKIPLENNPMKCPTLVLYKMVFLPKSTVCQGNSGKSFYSQKPAGKIGRSTSIVETSIVLSIVPGESRESFYGPTGSGPQ